MSGAGMYVCELSFLWILEKKKKPKAKKGEEKHLGGESGDIQGRGGQRKPLTLVTKDRDKDILWAGKSLLYVSWWGMYMKLNV